MANCLQIVKWCSAIILIKQGEVFKAKNKDLKNIVQSGSICAKEAIEEMFN